MCRRIVIVGAFNLVNPVEACLKEAGYLTLPVCCPGMASRFCERADGVALAMIDLDSGEYEGFTLAKELRRIDRTMPLVFLGADGHRSQVEKLYRMKAAMLTIDWGNADCSEVVETVRNMIGAPDVSC